MQEATKTKILATLLKPFTQLPLHTDLPRLAHIITISKSQKTLFKAQLGVPAVNNLENILIVLTQELLSPDEKRTISSITSSVEKHFLIGKDQPDKIINFLLNESFSYTGSLDANPVIRILKSMNQSVMAPALIELKLALGLNNMTKDVAGSWEISIDFEDEKTIIVKILKREQHIINMFQYQWSLTFVYQKQNELDVQCKDIYVRVTDLIFNNEEILKKPALKDEVKQVLKKYVADPNILLLCDTKQWYDFLKVYIYLLVSLYLFIS